MSLPSLLCRGRHASKVTEEEEDEECLKEEEDGLSGTGNTRLVTQPSCTCCLFIYMTPLSPLGLPANCCDSISLYLLCVYIEEWFVDMLVNCFFFLHRNVKSSFCAISLIIAKIYALAHFLFFSCPIPLF